jgi:aerobic-type carbon monoxide dehydrogenase small subunit (CoxS/CutS family)
VNTRDVRLTVNGRLEQVPAVPANERLLDTLRWKLALRGTKEGCRTGDCGACTVLADDRSILSCLTLTHEVEGSRILTVEAIAQDPEGQRVVTSFEKEAALQCGYCTPGFVVALTGLLKERGLGAPTAELLDNLQGNLCRCTGYAAIARAVASAREGEP